tara:strand:+ start:2581 stop:2727 length:147 start_codon:yes stop_codon:yes gene_type:complete
MTKVTIELSEDDVEELLRLIRDISTSLAQQTEMLSILLDEQVDRNNAH